MGRTTLLDVADRAGVSPKTVSRVLNAEPNVSEPMAARVRAAIAELAFVPHAAARRLSSGKALAIGLISGWRVTSAYSMALMSRIFDEAYRRDYDLRLFSSRAGPTRQVLDAFLGRQIDGLILDTRAAESETLIAQLESNDVPYVVIHPHRKRVGSRASYIQIDDRNSARRVVEHLIEIGHRTIGCVAHQSRLLPLAQRAIGYADALAGAGLAALPDLSAALPGEGFRVGFHGATRLLTAHKEMTAIFASTDEIARGVISAAWHLGRQVPEDLSVAGFDDAASLSLLTPRLTTVHQPFDDIASLAVQHLIDGIRTRSPQPLDVVLPTRLVMGESTEHGPSEPNRVGIITSSRRRREVRPPG